jgi:hypothetical protein
MFYGNINAIAALSGKVKKMPKISLHLRWQCATLKVSLQVWRG